MSSMNDLEREEIEFDVKIKKVCLIGNVILVVVFLTALYCLFGVIYTGEYVIKICSGVC